MRSPDGSVDHDELCANCRCPRWKHKHDAQCQNTACSCNKFVPDRVARDTTYTTKGREVIATVDGQTYRIPDMWLVGATNGGRTIAEALQLWHQQERIAAQTFRREV